ncbi:MAG: ATP-binding protein [Alphaproteobacteria bacterium]|nr:ATP-binding protein [Alphaproteobacteria bacterium]
MEKNMNEDFELYKLAQYLIKAIDSNLICEFHFDDLFSWFERKGFKYFKISKKEIGMKNTVIGINRKFDNGEKEFRKLLTSLNNALKVKYKKNCKVSKLERNLIYIKECLNLDKEQAELLGFYARTSLDKTAKSLFSGINEWINSEDIENVIINSSNEEIKKAKKNLLKYHLIYFVNFREEIALSSFAVDLLKIDANNVEEFKRKFIGDSLHSSLSWKDFKHVPNIDYIADLIKMAIKKKQKGVNILLYGEPGTGKTEFVKALADKIKVPIFSMEDNEDSDDNEYFHRGRKNNRYAKLMFSQKLVSKINKVCLFFDEAEDLFFRERFGDDDEGGISKLQINRLLEENTKPIIWTTNVLMKDAAFARRFTFSQEFEKPSENMRVRMWQKALKENDLPCSKKIAEKFSKKYKIPPAFISNATKSANLVNGGLDKVEKTLESMQKICAINTCEEEIKSVKEFNTDLINTDVDLVQLSSRIKQLHLKRFSLCLYGAPGTGKSAYAIWLAKQLNMPVVHKKCSDLLSMYVGETEEKIALAFKEAKEQGALLVFDEADSFLNDRSKVFRSWEKTQVNEMLTQMENATTPFVCTTNLMDGLDKAALRRFTFKVKYDFMSEAQKTKAFKYFFGFNKVDLTDLQNLSPADFELTYRKAEILGYLKNKDEIIKLLKAEEKEDENKKTKIGFNI